MPETPSARLLNGCLLQSPTQWPGRVKLLETATEEQFHELSAMPGVYYYRGNKRNGSPEGWYLPQSIIDLGKLPGLLHEYSDDQSSLTPSLDRTLMEHQRRSVSFLREITPQREGAILGADMGLGKAQPLHSLVMTPNGFECIADLRPGDEIYAADGTITSVRFLHPIEERDIYRVTFSDGSSCECCGDHLWSVHTPVQKHQGRSGRVLPLVDIMNDLRDAAGNRKHFVPMCIPLPFASRKLPIDPYLLGVLLGDGSFISGGVSLTNPEDDILARVDALLPEGVSRVPQPAESDSMHWRLSTGQRGRGNPLTEQLRQLRLWGCNSLSKHVPHEYLICSIEQRLQLLRGLMDTDGDVSIDGYATTFNTSSFKLKDAVVWLIQSLGGTARTSSRIPKYEYQGQKKEGQRAYRINVSLPLGIRPVSSKKHCARWKEFSKYHPTRSIDSVDYVGKEKARCISLQDERGLYLTDGCIVTHNCSISLQALHLDGFLERPGIVCGPLMSAAAWCGEETDATKYFGIHIKRIKGKKEPDTAQLAGAQHVFVNYDILEAWWTWLTTALKPAWVIFDECHLLMHASTQRSAAAYQLSHWHTIERRIGLTGTPVPKHRLDLWSQLRIVQPRQWGESKHQFGLRYCAARKEIASGTAGDEREFWNYSGETNDVELRARLAGTLLRYTRYEIAGQLPELVREVVRVEQTGEGLAEYKRAEWDIRRYLRERGELQEGQQLLEWGGQQIKVKASENKPSGLRLRAITTLIGLLSEFKAREAIRQVCMAIGEESHVVVFTWRRPAAALIANELRKLPAPGMDSAPIIFGPIDGTMKQDDRQVKAKAFAACARGVYVATLGAAGMSLNELAVASCEIFSDLHWNTYNLTQAESRLHRLSSRHKKIRSIFICVKQTIDELLIHHLTMKADAASTVSPHDQVGLNLIGDLSTNRCMTSEESLDQICALLAEMEGDE